MVSKGNPSILSYKDIRDKIPDKDLLWHYLGISNIPCFINSPLREDRRPSFGLYSPDGYKICYTDLATKDKGDIYKLLSLLWNCSNEDVVSRIQKDFIEKSNGSIKKLKGKEMPKYSKYKSNSKLEVKVREWRNYDIEYWQSYGISRKWLEFAEVYPISHKIVTKDGVKITFGADKYAYVFVERKEGNVTLKIYQPFNTNGYKWANNHDRSVVSLWSKIPEKGEKVVLCSSLKDALCLWANTGIPALALQGEGYGMSNTAISELKRRFTKIYILFDNDKAGLEDGRKLSQDTGFINLVLPQFEGGKDVSDLMKSKGIESFISTINGLFYDSNEKET